MEIVAAAGPTAASARSAPISINAERPGGRGPAGTAFRTAKPALAHHYLSEQSTAALPPRPLSAGAPAGAPLPLHLPGEPVGVMLFVAAEKGTFTPEFVELLERMTNNVSFAMRGFDRADEKVRTEEQKERLARMLAALSATNEAIVRAKSPAELFRFVC